MKVIIYIILILLNSTSYAIDWNKVGYISSMCVYMTTAGMTDGYYDAIRFGTEPYIIKPNRGGNNNPGNYHILKTANICSGFATGGFGYAILKSNKTKLHKFCILSGGLLIGRNLHDWGYKQIRFGNAFDYSKRANQSSLVYYKWNGSNITDGYISLTGKTGKIFDISVFVLGSLLLLF